MSDFVTGKELAAALDALILAENKLELLPSDITVSRISERTDWNAYRVKKVIGEWVRSGRAEYLGKRREPVRGAMVDAWRLITEKQAARVGG